MNAARAGSVGRRRLLGTSLAAAGVLALGRMARAAPPASPRFFRIGTGGAGGTYYPIGTLIAAGLTDRDGDGACGDAACVPGLVAVAQLSNGSVANIAALEAGTIDAAFAQANIVHWAYSGTGTYEGRAPAAGLRAIANLYREAFHVVARRGARIAQVGDLRGKRVSLDEPGSGTLIDARLVLKAFGLDESQLQAEYVKPDLASARVLEGKLDAFICVGGVPLRSVAELAEHEDVVLVSVEGPEVDRLLEEHRFYGRLQVPAGSYRGVPEARTLGIGAQLVTRADADEDLIHRVTRALWSDGMRLRLDHGHPRGREIRADHALDGVAIPLHPGAERYYREAGILK